MITKNRTQERNPFSDSASKVLRAALSNPSRVWGVRELARISDASPALVTLVFRRLERLGLASREETSQARILHPERLLRDWAAWYAIKPLKAFRYSCAKPTNAGAFLNHLKRFRADLPGRWALTAMAGASLVHPHADFKEAHIHLVKAEELAAHWAKTLGLAPNAEGFIHLAEPYYSDSGMMGVRESHGLPVVSDIQLYLDCYRYPVRGQEQAAHILSRSLAKQWKNAG